MITYALALSNLSKSQVKGLGDYERKAITSEEDRQRFDEKLNGSAELSCRAGGIFRYVSEEVCPRMDGEAQFLAPASQAMSWFVDFPNSTMKL